MFVSVTKSPLTVILFAYFLNYVPKTKKEYEFSGFLMLSHIFQKIFCWIISDSGSALAKT